MRADQGLIPPEAEARAVREEPGTAWFDRFENDGLARLRAGFLSAYGTELGAEVAGDVAAYAWEHRARLATMTNPDGYLFRVGQSALRPHLRRRRPMALPPVPVVFVDEVDPDLPKALRRLSERQRVAVVLVHVCGWTLEEAAEAMGISLSSVRTHVARALARLKEQLEGDEDE